MRLTVLGATGMTGSAITAEALDRGHRVTAASRRPRAAAASDRLVPHALDVADTTAVDQVLEGADAVVLAIRLAPGSESHLVPLTDGVLSAAARSGTRVLIVGGAAPLRSPHDPDLLLIDDPEHVPEEFRALARASLDQFRLFQAQVDDHIAAHGKTQYGWVYLSPPAVLVPGERSGRYRRGTDTLLTHEDGTSRITAADLAVAVLDELEDPGPDRHMTVIGSLSG